jgi:hypothetical protein
MNDLIKQLAMGYLRHSLTAFAGFLFAHALIQQSDQQIVVSALFALAGVAWSSSQKLIADQELKLAQKTIPPAAAPAPSAIPPQPPHEPTAIMNHEP